MPSWDRPEKNAPIQSIVERQIQLAATRYVDEIVVYNTEKDLEDILLTLPIDVRILGVEYEDKDFTGKDICNKRNIKLIFNSRDHSFSSSSLRKRVAEAERQTIMDIMLDLETLSTRPDATILTFGACKFSPYKQS
jgi:glycerol-3-phosphate cytidylyltransferase